MCFSPLEKKNLFQPRLCATAARFSFLTEARSSFYFSSSPIIYVIAQPVFWFNISQDSFYFVYAPAIENYGEMSVDMCFIWSMARAAVWLGKKNIKAR